jgi:hypothetical protein
MFSILITCKLKVATIFVGFRIEEACALIIAIHIELKPYKCSQYTMRTPYNVVRDKHEAWRS